MLGLQFRLVGSRVQGFGDLSFGGWGKEWASAYKH